MKTSLINQVKKCRKCKETLSVINFSRDSLGKYGVASTCKECYYKKTAKTQVRGHKFSEEIKQEIITRDKHCINPYCTYTRSLKLHCHHVYFHPLEKIHNFTEANMVDKGVVLCFSCHRDLHDGNTALDSFCHIYLANLYPYGKMH